PHLRVQGEGVLQGPGRGRASSAGGVQLRLPRARRARHSGEPPVGARLRTNSPRATLIGVALLAVLGASAQAGFTSARADDRLPPPPEHYFNDYAGVVPKDVAERLDAKLRAFDEQTSSQIVVA